MPPNMDEPEYDSDTFENPQDFTINLTSSSSSSSSQNSERNTPSHREQIQNLMLEEITEVDENFLPLDQNLKELLIKICDTDNLHQVTQIKLRVISQETPLQNLNHYMPALRELILDGSIVSSLRDIGFGFRNLKILKINHCNLNCIDDVFSLECLEELYAADNHIVDITPCAFLTNIKILDFSKNAIRDLNSLSYLKFCTDLTELNLNENPDLQLIPNLVREMLPHLKKLNEITFEGEVNTVTNMKRKRLVKDVGEFVVCFPPRLVLNRPPTMMEINKNKKNPESNGGFDVDNVEECTDEDDD